MDTICSKEIQGIVERFKKNDAFKSNRRKQSPESFSPVDISRAVEEIISTSSNTLDLSRKQLNHLEEEIFKVPNIKHLHLQGNALSKVPEDLFQQLSNLVWLDLRYNKITSLPSGVGAHKHLRSLLLEGNPIKALPVELGDVTSLKALNLRHCPLEFPPNDIVQRGLQSILSFLRNDRAGKSECAETPIPEMPPVEKLKLGDLMKSSLELSEEWPNEEERELFQNLKQQITQKDKEELLHGQSLALQDGLCEHSRQNRRKKTILNDSSMYDAKILNKRHEECKQAALKELKEKQAIVEQRKRDQEILQEWRKQTRMMQDKKDMKNKADNAFPPTIKNQVLKIAPYATDHDHNHIMDTLEQKKLLGSKQQERIRRMSMKSVKDFEQPRTPRVIELEHRIKQHIQMMQDKRKIPNETTLKEMQAAKEDLETAEMLQGQLLQMKEEEVPLEYRFTAFTGELSPTASPKVQPHNIFSKMQF